MDILLPVLIIMLYIKNSNNDGPFFKMLRKYRGPLGVLLAITLLVVFIYRNSDAIMFVFPILFLISTTARWIVDVKTRRQKQNN